MADVGYIREKVFDAVCALCKCDGPFEKRLWQAYMPSLSVLTSNDPPAELAEELNWVLQFCEHHLIPQLESMSPTEELDRSKVVEKLVALLVETSRMDGSSD